jgi:hypothetical protein
MKIGISTERKTICYAEFYVGKCKCIHVKLLIFKTQEIMGAKSKLSIGDDNFEGKGPVSLVSNDFTFGMVFLNPQDETIVGTLTFEAKLTDSKLPDWGAVDVECSFSVDPSTLNGIIGSVQISTGDSFTINCNDGTNSPVGTISGQSDTGTVTAGGPYQGKYRWVGKN